MEDLCASPDIDAVYVATPNALHAQHAVAAAERGKHLIVEKPLALTMEECTAIVEAAERNGVHVVVGHTHSFDPAIRKMRELVHRGDYGALAMIHTWNYNDYLYRPRSPWELDPEQGGGAVFNQAPHQVDSVRLIGGGLVRSVRATTGRWAEGRPVDGNYAAYLEFEDGTPATLVYSGYGHFDTAELHYWVGERGQPRDPQTNFRTRERFLARAQGGAAEEELREAIRYGGGGERRFLGGEGAHQFFFGLTLVSCQRADIRQSPDGLFVYGAGGRTEISLSDETSAAHAVIDELYEAIVLDEPPLHDARWGRATAEVCLAIHQSAGERREILLSHQTPCADAL